MARLLFTRTWVSIRGFTSQQKELHFFSRKSLFANANGPGDRDALRAVAKDESEYWVTTLKPIRRVRADVSPSYLYYDESLPICVHRVQMPELLYSSGSSGKRHIRNI